MTQPTTILPTALHLRKTEALDITWPDGRAVSLPLRFLRRHCPCAGCQGERDLLGNTHLPAIPTTYDGPITALSAQLVGNYALQITWSDRHAAGIYTFAYLHQLSDPANQPTTPAPQNPAQT